VRGLTQQVSTTMADFDLSDDEEEVLSFENSPTDEVQADRSNVVSCRKIFNTQTYQKSYYERLDGILMATWEESCY
jgi:hypothetical protein